MSGGPAVAIIADDLTGALDTAAPFAGNGLRTSLLVEGNDGWSAAPETQVLSLALETRHARPEIARARVSAATAFVRGLDAKILFKKIDSTLRGNVAAETAACLRTSGRRHALIAPAVPAHGRVTRGGEVFVDGVPLRDTAVARDALSQPPAAPLADVLRAADPEIAVHAMPRGQMPALDPATGLNAWLLDCETGAGLDAVARFGLAHRDQVLFVGASGLGGSVARAIAAPAVVAPPDRRPVGPILFVVGSRAPRTAEQVEALRADGVALRTLAPDDGRDAEGARALILTPGPQTGRSAADVAAAIGEAAARLVRRMAAGALVIVGGDTALATFRALGIRSAALDGEIMPGVPCGHAVLDRCRVTFVTKAGDFGSAGTLRSILHALRQEDSRIGPDVS